MNNLLKLVNDNLAKKMFDSLEDSKIQLIKSLKTGQRIILNYHLSKDVKKQITGIIIKKRNKNKHFCNIHILCGEIRTERFIKLINIFSPLVEIVNTLPVKKCRKADLSYLFNVNSIRSSLN